VHSLGFEYRVISDAPSACRINGQHHSTVPMRVMVNFMLRDCWVVHCVSEASSSWNGSSKQNPGRFRRSYLGTSMRQHTLRTT
jgi:hypothetical protein